MPLTTHEENGLVYFTSPLLDACDGISHGFSTRKGGVSKPPCDTLNLGPSRESDRAAVEENYRRFCGAVGADMRHVVLARQVHETTVLPVTEERAGMGLWRERDFTADALVTNTKDIPLLVFSADCGIILLHDPESGCVGAVHAGWRGCALGILEKTVRELTRLYGAKVERLVAAIGPCIGQCCFETDGDVPQSMTEALGEDAAPYLERRGLKWHVDLGGLNRQWLLKAGLSPEHIDVSGLCTHCRPDLFWSYRRVGGQRGAQAALISLV
ncbi:MAG: peptidoglycan editing factor PgeF [Oscillibacter sp.]|nr:peptidoglycan editing factor PgeF [Oscillibacter sp.]MEA4992448.1 peptidoglycan editing factor PgeF [Oscillibacter sp.]